MAFVTPPADDDFVLANKVAGVKEATPDAAVLSDRIDAADWHHVVDGAVPSARAGGDEKAQSAGHPPLSRKVFAAEETANNKPLKGADAFETHAADDGV